jgi:ATP-dependent RNA circularization protein (DNA/RNA ligase family)
MELKKFPKIFHLPWSLSSSSDDAWLDSGEVFEGKNVVVTEKMDGENTNMYRDYIHARSVGFTDYTPKMAWSRSWVKGLHGSIKHLIPEGWRICGENMFATHSIAYTNLESFFLVYMIVDEYNCCLPWDETKLFCEELGLTTVPVLWEGPWHEAVVKSCYVKAPTLRSVEPEGYVVRNADGFSMEPEEFRENVAKFVRAHHVQTDEHWMHGAFIQNQMKQSS